MQCIFVWEVKVYKIKLKKTCFIMKKGKFNWINWPFKFKAKTPSMCTYIGIQLQLYTCVLIYLCLQKRDRG